MEALNRQLGVLHEEVQRHFPHVRRISVVLHDAQTDELRTFLYSPADTTPISHYRTTLTSAHWLDSLRRSREKRVIADLQAVELGEQAHSRAIAAAGFRSSYTVPLYDGARFVGFVFFNADTPHAFDARVTAQLDLFVQIIALMIDRKLKSIATLTGGMQLLREISYLRNDETGSHLSRMAHYSGLIARALAGTLGRDDDWVEHVQLFAPMHDIGKITTPDAVLLKPGSLAERELAVMRQHPLKGEIILRKLLDDLQLADMPYVGGLLAIARNHHERWDGRGYPDGLAGAAIPVEARIVTVADVFDALTSARCYKPAWTLERSFAYLRDQSGHQFDPACVAAFLDQQDEVLRIRAIFPQASSDAT
ncbi:HD domain-containing phosphohydrolase [Fontimonas sp. SYSU GA230001]|uniref:HD-GYP domain-containing protein n=1 Tax=Fontimonas sp. SYSU GA230001 TaxID=3142450 RepID=UPI0032B5EDEB